jgi:hypothetical protein
MINRFSALLALSSLSACSTVYHKSESSGALEVEVKSSFVADLEVDATKRIQGAASQSVLFGLFHFGAPSNFADGVNYGTGGGGGGLFGPGAVETTKSAAAYNAMAPSKAEVLIAPQYLVRVTSKLLGAWKEISVTVSGYGAKIKGVNPAVQK